MAATAFSGCPSYRWLKATPYRITKGAVPSGSSRSMLWNWARASAYFPCSRSSFAMNERARALGGPMARARSNAALAFALSFVVLSVWTMMQPPRQKPAPAATEAQVEGTVAERHPTPAAPTPAKPEATAPAAAAEPTAAPAQTIPIERPLYLAELSSAAVEISPGVPDLSGPAAGTAPQASIWPHVEERIADLITEHRSTLVFANSRRLAERLTARLNEIWEERTYAAELAPGEGDVRAGRAERHTASAKPPAQVMAQSGASHGAPAVLARAHLRRLASEPRPDGSAEKPRTADPWKRLAELAGEDEPS